MGSVHVFVNATIAAFPDVVKQVANVITYVHPVVLMKFKYGRAVSVRAGFKMIVEFHQHVYLDEKGRIVMKWIVSPVIVRYILIHINRVRKRKLM